MKSSELILNKDGSIYHLGLRKGEVADTIITVGDPERVAAVSRYFTSIEIKRANREFITHTGYIDNKRLTVISTGIGTDNIDIVINELHAIFHFDEKGYPVENKKRLNFIRLGTSGTIRKEIPVDSILASEGALGFDGLMHFYDYQEHIQTVAEWRAGLDGIQKLPVPYLSMGNQDLLDHFSSIYKYKGITVTAPGFYAPQGRSINASIRQPGFLEVLSKSSISGIPITNLEMETAGIYGLCNLFGHRAISISAILANRLRGDFSTNPAKTVDRMIEESLEKISELH